MSDRSHATVSPSAAYRWLNCPPSVRLSEDYPDEDTEASRAGTLAHDIAVLLLLNHYSQGAAEYNEKSLKMAQQIPEYSTDIYEAAVQYVEYVCKIIDAIPEDRRWFLIEEKVDLSGYIPGGYGHADLILLDYDARVLHVFDFKSGTGEAVHAEGNPQLRLYALGSLFLLEDMDQQVNQCVLHIVQPRLNLYSTETISLTDLVLWGDSIIKPAIHAFQGTGKQAAGDWCKHCKVRGICSEYAPKSVIAETEHMINELPIEEPDPEKTLAQSPPALDRFWTTYNYTLSGALMSKLAHRARLIITWYNEVKRLILVELKSGHKVPGWKLRPGKKSRVWTDRNKAFKHAVGLELPDGRIVTEEMLYKREPHSVAQVEKLLGKRLFNSEMKDYVSEVLGADVAAPDDGENWTNLTNDEEDE